MEAIVLAGGFGTRLKSVVSDVPKPMAPMDTKGTPFLYYVLRELEAQGVTHVVLSTGYMHEVIEDYFGDTFGAMRVSYSCEDTPLFTGGAVKKALSLCEEENVFVLNGDTFFDVELKDMLCQHKDNQADFTMAVREMHDFDRYGTVVLEAGRVTEFREKQPCERGWINGGVYCVKQELLKAFPMTKFSLEKDFLEKKLEELRVEAFCSDGYFIDIGIPEDYEKAKRHFGGRE